MRNIAVFASGYGSNFQSILDYFSDNQFDIVVKLLVSDNPNSYAVERAKKNNVEYFAFNPKDYKFKHNYEEIIIDKLSKYEIDLIVLAGYMRIIGRSILSCFPNKIINVHPSLLPSFKGKDAIGQAISAKADVTGVTVHFVNEFLDSGEIIIQESLDISNLKKREEIEEKIHEIEHRLLPQAIIKTMEEINEKSID